MLGRKKRICMISLNGVTGSPTTIFSLCHFPSLGLQQLQSSWFQSSMVPASLAAKFMPLVLEDQITQNSRLHLLAYRNCLFGSDYLWDCHCYSGAHPYGLTRWFNLWPSTAVESTLFEQRRNVNQKNSRHPSVLWTSHGKGPCLAIPGQE